MIPVRLGALLVALTPAIAAAHVRMAPPTGEPGAAYEGALVIGHGCKGSPTRSVSVDLPVALAPRVGAPPGWTVEARSSAAGLAATWRGQGDPHAALILPISLPISLTLPKARGPLYLVVRQVCETGEAVWSDIPAPGQDPHALSNPAPMISVGGSAPAMTMDMDGMSHRRP